METITRSGVCEILETCRQLFKAFKINEYVVGAWHRQLEGFTFDEVKNALETWIGTEPKQTGPAVAEIKRLCSVASMGRRVKASQRANLAVSEEQGKAFLDNHALAKVYTGENTFRLADRASIVTLPDGRAVDRMDFILDTLGEAETCRLLRTGFEAKSGVKFQGSIWGLMASTENRLAFKEAVNALEAMALEKSRRNHDGGVYA